MNSKHRATRALIQQLSHSSDNIRNIAAISLGKLKEPLCSDALLAVLEDEDEIVVMSAVQALGELQAANAEHALLKMYENESDIDLKPIIIEALGRIALNENVDEVPIVHFLLKVDSELDHSEWDSDEEEWDEWWDSQIKAIEALGNLGITDVVPMLISKLEDEDAYEIETVIFSALPKMGKVGEEALIDFLSSDDPGHCRNAVKNLGSLKSNEAKTALMKMLQHEDISLCVSAAKSLLNDSDETSIFTVFECLKDPRVEIRRRILEALTQANVDVPDDLLAELLVDSDESVQLQTLRTVSRQDKRQLGNAVFASLRTPSLEVVTEVIKTLGKIGFDEARETVGVLLTKQGLGTVIRVQCVIALGRIGDEMDLPLLLEMIKDPEMPVRLNSLNTIADLKLEESEAILIAALKGYQLTIQDLEIQKQKQDSEISEHFALSEECYVETNKALHQDIKHFAASVLGRFNSTQVFDALKEALTEQNLLLQEAAVQSLGMIGNPDAVDVLEKLYENSEEDLKKTIIQALEKIVSRISIEALIQIYTNDEAGKQHIQILHALTELMSQIPSDEPLEDIRSFAISLLSNQNSSIRKASAELLMTIYEKCKDSEILNQVVEIAFLEDGSYGKEMGRLFRNIAKEEGSEIFSHCLENSDSEAQIKASMEALQVIHQT